MKLFFSLHVLQFYVWLIIIIASSVQYMKSVWHRFGDIDSLVMKSGGTRAGLNKWIKLLTNIIFNLQKRVAIKQKLFSYTFTKTKTLQPLLLHSHKLILKFRWYFNQKLILVIMSNKYTKSNSDQSDQLSNGLVIIF